MSIHILLRRSVADKNVAKITGNFNSHGNDCIQICMIVKKGALLTGCIVAKEFSFSKTRPIFETLV